MAAKTLKSAKRRWIDVMIVGCGLLEDTHDMDGAREMWRKVLATPNANADQQRIARRRLDALLPKEAGNGD